jgi:hypothetical protein
LTKISHFKHVKLKFKNKWKLETKRKTNTTKRKPFLLFQKTLLRGSKTHPSIPSYSNIDSSFLFHSHALGFQRFILIPLLIPTVATLLPTKTQNPNNPKPKVEATDDWRSVVVFKPRNHTILQLKLSKRCQESLYEWIWKIKEGFWFLQCKRWLQLKRWRFLGTCLFKAYWLHIFVGIKGYGFRYFDLVSSISVIWAIIIIICIFNKKYYY